MESSASHTQRAGPSLLQNQAGAPPVSGAQTTISCGWMSLLTALGSWDLISSAALLKPLLT